ncbi:hypothetical protein [Vibrio furnissii]|nr:hypothetical protein [Vibrio furnissii]
MRDLTSPESTMFGLHQTVITERFDSTHIPDGSFAHESGQALKEAV